jgi:putative acyl-CoA dehydrogenase
MAIEVNPRTELRTHEVTNQPWPLGKYNAFDCDPILRQGVEREGAGWACQALMDLGEAVGDPENVELATLANRHEPELRRYDAGGRRVDTIDFHPAWHQIMSLAYRHGLGAKPWLEPRAGAHVAKAASSILFNELEGGCMCPVAITYGSVPMIRRQADIAALWEGPLLSTRYDGRNLPIDRKTGATAAFAATEKQGGSDVRGNSTIARPAGAPGPGREYLLTGHKWFVSAAGADVILASAQTDNGPSMFLLPRWLPDGTRNLISIERIKDKMGNHSNPSTEMEFDGAHGWMIGEEGRGIAAMMVFMQYSRFEVALMPVGEMRLTLTHALNYARQRSVFGKTLAQQPLMKNVLADLSIEYEASVNLALRVGRSFDEGPANESQRAFSRLAVAIAKYWHNKRCVTFVQEAMEVHGGAGYVEDSVIPRFYREAPVNNIWEGSGNVICLDILRTLRSDPVVKEALFTELELSRGNNRLLDAAVDGLHSLIADTSVAESQARKIAERLALTLQASLLVRNADAVVADAFCGSRLGSEWSGLFGTLADSAPVDRIIARASAGELA